MPILLLALACTDYEVTELGLTEHFTQPEVPDATDVLFVIDDSASMAEEQDRLGQNFEAFIEVMVDSEADFQLGVTTTDLAGQGRLSGPVLGAESEDVGERFLEALQVGTDGDRDERGFQTALLALDDDNGLVRTGSWVSVVFLSDEDDHSPGEVDEHVGELSLFGDEGMAVHGIVGDLPVGCASGTSAASAAERYVEAIEATGGFRDSICAEDYSAILERIALSTIGWNDTFELADLPEPESLVVWVDGVQMPNRGVDGWTYEPGDNALLFHGRAVPRPGMEVFVEYLPLLGN
jgi:hypothetical protein